MSPPAYQGQLKPRQDNCFRSWTGWGLREFKAFQEFAVSIGLQYEYIALNLNHQQGAVRVNGCFNRWV